MEVKTYTIDEIKNIVTPIAEKYQIAQVYLFGSFARGDFDEQSDIDIRIEKGNLKGMFALCGFYTEVSDALGRKVDVLTTGSLSDEFLESIKLIRSQTAFCLLYFSLGKSHNTGVIDGVYKPILCLYVFGNEF